MTHGWFSRKQLSLSFDFWNSPNSFYVALFENTHGEEVFATVTTTDFERSNGPNFNDMVYVGKVSKYLGMKRVALTKINKLISTSNLKHHFTPPI